MEIDPKEVLEEPKPKKNGTQTKLIRFGILGLVLVGAAWYGLGIMAFNRTHVSTDDAYVTTDVIPISSEEVGSVDKVFAKLNGHVKEGEVLVALAESSYYADLKQAEANLAAAQANASGGQASVDLASMTSSAQREEAAGGIGAASADVETARLAAVQANAGVQSFRSAAEAADAQYRAALDTAEVRQSEITRARQQAAAARSQTTSAEAQLRSARSSAASLKSAADFATNEASRYAQLAADGAVSRASAESKQTEAIRAQSAADAGDEAVRSAQALVDQRKAEVLAADAAIKQAESAAKQARSQAESYGKLANQSRSQISQAQAAARASSQAIESARQRAAQAAARLKEASVVGEKTSISDASKRAAEAKVKEAEAALIKAQIAMRRVQIKAPVSGTVSRKNVQIGLQVTAGQPLIALIPDQAPWIMANFKETQMNRIHVGQIAEIEVDAIPGIKFRGHIDSISGGTGSAFALLPADNATGNFTKVVQRVPVKIVLDPNQPHLDSLRTGLSSTVIISTQ